MNLNEMNYEKNNRNNDFYTKNKWDSYEINNLNVIEFLNFIVPKIKDKMEIRKSENRSLVDILREFDLLRMLTPIEAGGLQVNYISEFEIIRSLSALDPSLAWVFINLAGTSARIAAVCPENIMQSLFYQKNFPAIAMHVNPYSSFFSLIDENNVKLNGMWKFVTGVVEADLMIGIGRADKSMAELFNKQDVHLATALQKNIFHINKTGVSPVGLTETGTYPCTSETIIPIKSIWEYNHNTPLRGGPYFKLRRSPIKHAAFAIGILESLLILLKETYRGKNMNSFDRMDYVDWDITTSSCVELIRKELNMLDKIVQSNLEEAEHLMNKIHGIACWITGKSVEISTKIMVKYGNIMQSFEQIQIKTLAIIAASQHKMVRDENQELYLQ